ncbi:MAG: response regulator [Desulfobacterales bacterium]|nr:response regulator [Desulfobacterales bacterium]
MELKAFNQETILVVDDNPVNIKLIETILYHNGYVPICVKNGKQCIETSGQCGCNLILLDINMPDMSGLDVCLHLRQQKSTQDIPIIFVTGMTDNEMLKEAFASGGTDYVRKPINTIELLVRIKSALNQQRLKHDLLQREKLAAILEMSGAVCHELNQPMQTITMCAEMIFTSIPQTHQLYKDVFKIKEQVNRMAALTQKIMRITKYETRDYIKGQQIIDIEKASQPINFRK